MTHPSLKSPSPFLTKKRKTDIAVLPLSGKSLKTWLGKQPVHTKRAVADAGFKGQKGQTLILRNDKGRATGILAGIQDPCSLYDLAPAVQALRQHFSADVLKKTSFTFSASLLKKTDADNAHISWGLACYQFTAYKAGQAQPALTWSNKADRKRVKTFVDSIALLRSLINIPANDLGPDELEAAARTVAGTFDAKMKTVKGAALEKGFPLVHTVGHGSERRPRLIDITWGKAKDPKVTLVGKGVCFDTGGLNLKPTRYMALMKKDMGGAAHALALAQMIMALKLPVRLRLLIPAVENSVSGVAFRPGDVLSSRKGITVENTNTDAEGRLILADALTYACEEKPDLLVDFATLTGSARAALGPDIPALFSTNDKVAGDIQKLGFAHEDPVWAMPLWEGYNKHIGSPIADCTNSAGLPGDLIYSALFLKQFLTGKPDWVHLDCYAWEHTGRPGRPKGGADTGMRAVLAYIEERYG